MLIMPEYNTPYILEAQAPAYPDYFWALDAKEQDFFLNSLVQLEIHERPWDRAEGE